MRALVVYESMFGHTRAIAEHIASGLRSTIAEVDVVSSATMKEQGAAASSGADLLVVGGPTHVHSLPSVRTRQAAVSDPARYGAGSEPEPHASGPGLREWLAGLARASEGSAAAAFDTRASGPALLTGRASRLIARRLRARGFRLVATPKSFVVGSDAVLGEAAAAVAEQWGRTLAQAVCRESLEDMPFSEPE